MIFKLILDRKNKPNRPPYVKDAILRPTSIKDELVSSNKKAKTIKTIPHKRLINLEAFKELFLSNISTTVDVVSELIDELNVDIAADIAPAKSKPLNPTGTVSYTHLTLPTICSV